MLNSILELVRGMHHTIKKEDVLKTTEFVFNNLNNEVIPTLDNLMQVKDLEQIVDTNIFSMISRSADIKSKDARDAVKKLKNGFVGINKSYKQVVGLIEDELSDVVTNKTVTAKDAAILRMVNDIGAMNNFVMDLSYLVIMNKEETNLPKFKMKTVKNNINGFGNAFQAYGDKFSSTLKDMSKISSTLISISEGKESFLGLNLKKTGKTVDLPMANGFINNPIYHIRMWLVDREVEKYESLKDKKRLVELRLMELKLEESNESDPKLRKQIEYYEDKLSKIEYSIEKIEND